MAIIAVIIDDLFEDSEYKKPAEAFKKAGHELIPGGYSPDRLRANENAVSLVRDFVKSTKPVFSICHAPQILITAQVLEGRKIIGWKSIVQDIKNAGAEFIDKEVVEDGSLISSRHPGDLPAFIKASLKKL
jgi:protease I